MIFQTKVFYQLLQIVLQLAMAADNIMDIREFTDNLCNGPQGGFVVFSFDKFP